MSIITDLAWIPPKTVAKSFCGYAHCLDPLWCQASITGVQSQLLASGLKFSSETEALSQYDFSEIKKIVVRWFSVFSKYLLSKEWKKPFLCQMQGIVHGEVF